jgi:hypothetical protein
VPVELSLDVGELARQLAVRDAFPTWLWNQLEWKKAGYAAARGIEKPWEWIHVLTQNYSTALIGWIIAHLSPLPRRKRMRYNTIAGEIEKIILDTYGHLGSDHPAFLVRTRAQAEEVARIWKRNQARARTAWERIEEESVP